MAKHRVRLAPVLTTPAPAPAIVQPPIHPLILATVRSACEGDWHRVRRVRNEDGYAVAVVVRNG